MSLRARVNALYTGTISEVSSKIIVTKNDKELRRAEIGNNRNKVIEILVRL